MNNPIHMSPYTIFMKIPSKKRKQIGVLTSGESYNFQCLFIPYLAKVKVNMWRILYQ